MATLLTQNDIRNSLTDIGLATLDLFFPDVYYVCPDWDWVQEIFFPNWRFVMDTLGVATWQPEANDCDDFAALCKSYLRILHVRTKSRPPGAAIAVADLNYWLQKETSTTPGLLHAINLVICNLGKGPQVKFFEPQIPKALTLSPTQIQDITYVAF